jgi:hypothetical protein
MNQLIIIFEFVEETPEKINSFRDRIRGFGMYAFVSQRACLVWTEQTAANVRDNLKAHLSTTDKLYVGTTSAPSAWLTSVGQDVTDYIKKNLK